MRCLGKIYLCTEDNLHLFAQYRIYDDIYRLDTAYCRDIDDQITPDHLESI